jgi:hypothetical protein
MSVKCSRAVKFYPALGRLLPFEKTVTFWNNYVSSIQGDRFNCCRCIDFFPTIDTPDLIKLSLIKSWGCNVIMYFFPVQAIRREFYVPRSALVISRDGSRNQFVAAGLPTVRQGCLQNVQHNLIIKRVSLITRSRKTPIERFDFKSNYIREVLMELYLHARPGVTNIR